MKTRILTNWNFTRALYVLMGTLVIIQSVVNKQWFGVAFGCYFASMGLFAFGCASGSCVSNASAKHHKVDNIEEEVVFEELKSK